jgi:hypothetical protein
MAATMQRSAMISRKPAVAVQAAKAASAAPKRAPSAYNLFYKAKYSEVRERLVAENGGVAPSLSVCNQEVRTLWSQLPTYEKVPFESEAKKIKEQMLADR